MDKKRHPAVLVIAVLHFIFGGGGVLCGVCGLGGMALQSSGAMEQFQENLHEGMGKDPKAAKELEKQRDLQKEMLRAIEEHNPYGMLVEGLKAGVGLLMGLTLVIAGVGLLKVRPWARLLSILYGIVGLLLGVFNLIWTIAVVLPANEEMMKLMVEKSEGPNKAAMEFATQIGQFSGPLTLIPVVFGMLYPLAVLIVMFWPTVAANFRDTPAGPADEGDGLAHEDRWRV